MNHYYLTYRSITGAQRAQRTLHSSGIRSQLLRTPRSIATEGCGYSLRLGADQVRRALDTLARRGIPCNKTFLVYPDGRSLEVWL